jgi:hypothetical protein
MWVHQVEESLVHWDSTNADTLPTRRISVRNDHSAWAESSEVEGLVYQYTNETKSVYAWVEPSGV